MKISQIIPLLGNNSLDITLNVGTLTTKYFKTELLKYKSLKTDFDIEDFIYYWGCFFEMQKQNLNRIYGAMTTEYNALENYNKTETGTVVTDSDGTSENNLQNLNNATNTTSRTTYNSSNLNLAESSTFTDIDKKTTSSTSFDTTETKQNVTSGNIGVTTSQQMLKSEYEIRTIYMYQIIVEMFINNFAY